MFFNDVDEIIGIFWYKIKVYFNLLRSLQFQSKPVKIGVSVYFSDIP